MLVDSVESMMMHGLQILILIYWKILEGLFCARQPVELHLTRWILISVLGVDLNFKVVMKSSSSVPKK